MPVTTFRDVFNKGKCLFKNRVKKDTTLEQALEVYACAIIDIEKAVDLSSVKLKDLEIFELCKLKAKNLLSEIINKLIATDIGIQAALTAMQNTLNTSLQSLNNFKDEKVKLSATDTVAGYLADKIISPQVGCIKVEKTQVGVESFSIMGFAPVGAVMYIDAGRVGDFDAQGKGKTGTDVWGWAISNGQNGTRNRLGKFPRYINANSDAGNSGGSNEITLKPSDIPGLEFPVTGSIGASSQSNKKFQFKLEANKISDGSGGSVYLLRVGTGQTGANTIETIPVDLSHSHSFDLKSKYENPTPTKISFVPQYLYEIPIQRINP